MNSGWSNRRNGIWGCLLALTGSFGCDQAQITDPPQGAEASATAELHLRMVYRGQAEGNRVGAGKVVQVPDVAYWNTHDIGSWDEWAEVLKNDLSLNTGPEINQALEIQGGQATGTLRVQAGEKLIFVGLFAGGRMKYAGEGRAAAFPGERNEVIVEVVPLAEESFAVDEVRVLVYQAEALQSIPLPPGHPSATPVSSGQPFTTAAR